MQRIYTYKRVVCVCLLVCWFVCFLSATRHLSTLRRCLRVAERAGANVAGGPARARASACTLGAHARSCRTTSQRKNHCADAFQKQLAVRARAYCRIRNCRDFQKKGKKKTNMPLSKFSLQFAFSWSVYFSNRTESYLIFGRSRPWSARYIIRNITFLLPADVLLTSLKYSVPASMSASCLSVIGMKGLRELYANLNGDSS